MALVVWESDLRSHIARAKTGLQQLDHLLERPEPLPTAVIVWQRTLGLTTHLVGIVDSLSVWTPGVVKKHPRLGEFEQLCAAKISASKAWRRSNERDAWMRELVRDLRGTLERVEAFLSSTRCGGMSLLLQLVGHNHYRTSIMACCAELLVGVKHLLRNMVYQEYFILAYNNKKAKDETVERVWIDHTYEPLMESIEALAVEAFLNI